MADSIQIAALAGGELRVPSSGGKLREVVLALPLGRLLVKMVRIPRENLDDPVAFVTPILKSMSPYPDEALSVSCETVRETEDARIVIASALPEGSADDLATALDASGLNVTRIDAVPFGLFEAIRERLAAGEHGVRRLLLIGDADGLSVLVLDDDVPSAIRAVSTGTDLNRELMLSLLEAEEFAGDLPLKEVLTVGEVPTEGLDRFAPVRALGDLGDPLAGVAKRSETPGTINVLPESWREVLEESRFKRKMGLTFGIAAAVWVVALLFLIGLPKFYKYKTTRVNDRPAQKAQAEKVREKKKQVEAVKAVSNHDYGALESLRAVVKELPAGCLDLTRWNFKRGEELTFDGTYREGEEDEVWQFNARLDGLKLSAVTGNEDDAEVPYFTRVTLPKGLVKRTFGIRCSFKEEEGQ